MTDMTIGQRLAVQRKLKNLSQEALAEQLEVSRQAVSKWESDAAIPEVDKLIALGKIYGVSVGWLLGTEKETGEKAEFTEAQIRAVEEIVSRSAPKKRTWLPWVVCLVLAVLAVWAFQNPAAVPTEDDAVEAQMESLQFQIDELNAMMTAHIADSDILSGMSYFAIWDPETFTVNMIFGFEPKVYREAEEAYLLVGMGAARPESFPCKWDEGRYVVTVPLAPGNGYTYTFRLVSENGFQDQNLLRDDFTDVDYISNIENNIRFHIDPEHPKYMQMRKGEHAWLDVNLKTYTYDAPILTPRIFPAEGQGYKDIQILLLYNEEVIWQESYLDAVKKLTGSHWISMEALHPNISVDLPGLEYGDKLTLYLHAELIDGTCINTPLDELYAWERPG